MEWSWDHAFAVLPQLLKGLVVTIEATIVASLLAYILGLAIAILKMSNRKSTRVSFRAADQYSNSHYTYLEPMTLVGVFFLLVSIPSAMLAMKLEKKFKPIKVAR